MTDEVTLFDIESVPDSHRGELLALQTALAAAGDKTRVERAERLGLNGSAALLRRKLQARSSDIAQVRPEWALANNAAFVAAPRSRTAGLNLEGRVFLHDYVASLDSEGKVLTAILSGPVVVASWINLQYYASRVAPGHYSAGNKVLHNVVAGIGAIEGNSGDLRVGLPLQSLHNGLQFVHEPRRLNVVIEASRAQLEKVLFGLTHAKALVENQWIHLFAIEEDQVYRWSPDGWRDGAGPRRASPSALPDGWLL